MRDAVRVADDLVVSSKVAIPPAELGWRFSRSSGPGGQGVNTTDSRVQLTFDVVNSPSIPERLRDRAVERLASKLVDGCLVITASEQRSQLQNRRAAEGRLVLLLREAIAPPPRARRATKPTRGSTDRRIKAKKGRGVTKRLRGVTSTDLD
jgi:ribosome-associated protein